jgi:hypothetical protein
MNGRIIKNDTHRQLENQKCSNTFVHCLCVSFFIILPFILLMFYYSRYPLFFPLLCRNTGYLVEGEGGFDTYWLLNVEIQFKAYDAFLEYLWQGTQSQKIGKTNNLNIFVTPKGLNRIANIGYLRHIRKWLLFNATLAKLHFEEMMMIMSALEQCKWTRTKIKIKYAW